jgi:hypothetical protein
MGAQASSLSSLLASLRSLCDGEERLELLQPPLWTVRTLESRGPLEEPDDWMKGAVGMVR